MMSIAISKPGIYTTIQDQGRHGFQRFGINPGGVCDPAAPRLLNALLGNADDAAVIETHFPAVELSFASSREFSIGGGDFAATLNGRSIPNWRIHHARIGDTLRFRGRKTGARAYIAVRGGLKVPKWLGSSSTNVRMGSGGFEGRALRRGDVVQMFKASAVSKSTGLAISPSMIPEYSQNPIVRMIETGETNILSAKTRRQMADATYSISKDSDRMGYRLDGPSLVPKRRFEMVTSGTTFGTVQLLPDGRLVILMADHQTSGGYARIGTVIARDLPLLAQLGQNDRLRLEYVSIETAEQEMLRYERDLSILRYAASSEWR